MNNKIKQEIKRIEIPKNLHERSKLGVKKAKAEQPKRRYKNPLVAVAIVAIVGLSILLTPIGQATFNGLFEVTKFEKRPHNKELSFGYSWEGIAGADLVTHDSLEEMENTYAIKLPFPEQLLMKEENAEYRATVDEDGKFISYDISFQTTTRNYLVSATNIEETSPQFRAQTTDGTAIEKEVLVNGTAATLLGINEMDGYSIYIENGQWQIIITCFARGIHEEGQFDVTEEELIRIAESIQW